MKKKARLFATFDNPDDWEIIGDIVVEDGKAVLKPEKRILRAEDFVDGDGNPKSFPVTEYPPGSGKYVGYVSNGTTWDDYCFNHDSIDDANYHVIQYSAMAPSIPSTSISATIGRASISSRNTDLLAYEIGEDGRVVHRPQWDDTSIQWSGYNTFYDKSPFRGGRWVLVRAFVCGSVAHDAELLGYEGRMGFMANLAIRSSVTQGRIRFYNFVDYPMYIRSCGEEYSDTTNPGILEIYKFKWGIVYPKNDLELYYEITDEVLQAYQNGTAELYFPNQGRWMTRFLFSDYIKDIINVSEYAKIIQVYNNWGLDNFPFYSSTGKHYILSGVLSFPGSDFMLRVGDKFGPQSFTVLDWGIPEGLLVVDRQLCFHACNIVPCAIRYPVELDEGTGLPKDIVPLDFNGNLFTFDDHGQGVFQVGDKWTFGFIMYNIPDPTITHEVTELAVIANPTPKPGMGVWPVEISFEFEEDETQPATQELKIWSDDDTGFDQTLEWEATTEASWISLDKTSGTSDGPPDSMSITIDPTVLQPGTYSSTITVQGADQTRQVTVSVTKKQKLSIIPRNKPIIVKR